MRECWVNVSVVPDRNGRKEAILGSVWATREAAIAVGEYTDYRLHVRLKPEPVKPRGSWHADRLAAALVKR
jgi:hypothetical protein